MEQAKKNKILTLIVGVFLFIFLVKIYLTFFTGDFKVVSKFSHEFLDLIYRGKYIEAFTCVDSSKITIEDLQKVSNLSSHYEPGSIFVSQETEKFFSTGFKPVLTDSDKANDKALEFRIEKVHGKWKITSYIQE